MGSDFRLEEFLPYRINRLAEQVSDSLARVYARRFSISVAQWRVLATLQEYPGLSAKRVAEEGNMDKVRVSRAVTDLEARDLLERRASSRDGRASELRLTTSGRRLFRKIAPLALSWEKEFLEGLSDEQRDGLMEALEHLENTLRLPTEAAPVSPSKES